MEVEITEKICSRCKQKKNIENEFYQIEKGKPEKAPRCKKCDNISGKSSYATNITTNREKRKTWQDKNRELHNKHQRAYYARKRENKTWGIFM